MVEIHTAARGRDVIFSAIARSFGSVCDGATRNRTSFPASSRSSSCCEIIGNG
jgi:hypothetical protein